VEGNFFRSRTMNHVNGNPPCCRAVFRCFFSALLTLAAVAGADDCGTGRRPLFVYADSSAIRAAPDGFISRLIRQLQQPLDEIGYCVLKFSPAFLSDTTLQDEQVMAISMQYSLTERRGEPLPAVEGAHDATGSGQARMVVTLLQITDWSPRQVKRALESPLLTLDYRPEELSTFESVLIRKIVENLRTQYICHLRIQSIPEGATIRSRSGLEGITPLEWITPVGKLSITGELEGYEPLRRRIDLTSPGNHTYVLELGKRRFYHSGFFMPTVLLGIASVGCFAAERIVYNRYERLAKEDRLSAEERAENKPDPFAQTFTIAKNLERAAAVTAGLAGVSFVCCFFF
jgi:hypothetical protein